MSGRHSVSYAQQRNSLTEKTKFMGNIYYFGYPTPTTGGDFVNIDHVLALNKLGFTAKIIYDGQYSVSSKLPKNSQPIQSINFREDDYFVVPENDYRLLKFAHNLKSKLIIHNQNNYYLFNAVNSVLGLEHKRFDTIICPSDVSAKMLIEAGYRGEVAVIKPYLPSYFAPQKKKLRIAFSPRKLPIQSGALLTTFRSMFPNYLNIEWVAIKNMDRESVANLLSESAIYASFSNLESLGLSTLEAMKCGCIVVGDHGGGGSEYANKENGLWVRADELITYSRKIVDAIELFQKFGADNSLSVAAIKSANVFSSENFLNSLESFWLKRASKSD